MKWTLYDCDTCEDQVAEEKCYLCVKSDSKYRPNKTQRKVITLESKLEKAYDMAHSLRYDIFDSVDEVNGILEKLMDTLDIKHKEEDL